jgi:hypothetical protein
MRRGFAVAFAAAVVLAGLAASATTAAGNTMVFHDTFSDANPDANQCGIDGSSVVHGQDITQVYADGTARVEVNFKYVFTSSATGKSFEISAAVQETGAGPIFNPDGTVSFVSTFKGLPQKLKVPNGPILTRDAGYVTIYETFDPNTGDLVSQTLSPDHGPHPSLADPGLFCDVIVAALT